MSECQCGGISRSKVNGRKVWAWSLVIDEVVQRNEPSDNRDEVRER